MARLFTLTGLYFWDKYQEFIPASDEDLGVVKVLKLSKEHMYIEESKCYQFV